MDSLRIWSNAGLTGEDTSFDELVRSRSGGKVLVELVLHIKSAYVYLPV